MPMQQIAITIKLVIFRIDNNELLVYTKDTHLPSESIVETDSLDEQVRKIFLKYIGFRLGNNYVEQLYTITNRKNEITICYSVLLPTDILLTTPTSNWIKAQKSKSDKQIIAYATQRLQWKIEYTNVVYSLLPHTFTLSDLQKTYEVILGKKLDKRNFRKKILSLQFLKPTGEKRIDSARPAQMYTFIKRSPILAKVFS